jgi:hypothetical protein
MAASNVKEVLKAEERRLEALLEGVRGLLAQYDDSDGEAAGPKNNGHTLNGSAPTRRLVRPLVPTSKTARVTAAAETYLENKGKRATSGEIAKWLIAQGLGPILEGGDPGMRTSAFLSASKKFDNKAGEGYGLVKWSQKEAAH